MSDIIDRLKHHTTVCAVNNNTHWSRYADITERYYDEKQYKENPLYNVLTSVGIRTPINANDGIVIPFHNYTVKNWNIYEYDDVKIRHTHFLNPSIIMYNNMLLCVFRGENKNFFNEKMLYLGILNEEFSPLKIQLLDTAYVNDDETNMEWRTKHNGDYLEYPASIGAEDARLYIRNEKLRIYYGDGFKVYDAELNEYNGTFRVENIVDYAESKIYMRENNLKLDNGCWEKNWSIFDNDTDDGLTRWCYSLNKNEHVVIECDSRHGTIVNVHRSWCPDIRVWDKKLNGIRGGTPAYLLPGDDRYRITFFHTNTPVMLDDKNKIRLYYTGYYIFENKEPYRVVVVGKSPLISPSVFPPNIPTPAAGSNQPTLVTFPAGAIYRSELNGWFLSYGFNDYQCRVTFVHNEFLKFPDDYKCQTSSCPFLSSHRE